MREYLRSEGFDFNSSPKELDEAFVRATPSNDRARLRFIWASSGQARLNALYKFPKTLRQASLLFSHDRDRVLASYEWLARLPGGHRSDAILDAGCSQGALTRYIARLLPNSKIIGVDALNNLIDIARAASGAFDNIEYFSSSYEQLDLEAESVGLVVSAVGLDLEEVSGSKRSSDLVRLDQTYVSPETIALMEEIAGSALRAWRRVTRNEGSLKCVIRLPDFAALFSFVEVAALAGWSLRRQESTYIRTMTERFPALTFTATAPKADEINRGELFEWSIEVVRDQERR